MAACHAACSVPSHLDAGAPGQRIRCSHGERSLRRAPEFLRKGRFDEIFFVDLPDAAEREAILRIHLSQRRQILGFRRAGARRRLRRV